MAARSAAPYLKLPHLEVKGMLFVLAFDKLGFGQTPGWWSLGGSGLILGIAVQKQQSSGGREHDEEVASLTSTSPAWVHLLPTIQKQR